MIFEKKLDKQKIIWMIMPFFENFFNYRFFFVLETNLEMIETIILYRK